MQYMPSSFLAVVVVVVVGDVFFVYCRSVGGEAWSGRMIWS